jgi:UDP-N-acetylglucosamine 4,6-dehydratase
MVVFSRLTRLPRPAKAIILVLIDALIAAMTFWLAALARSGRIPAMSWYYIIAATAFVMVLVPAVGVLCGLYRPVVRFHIPRLSARAGLVSAITGSMLACFGVAGGAAWPQALGLGVVFSLVLFVLILLSRHEARLLLGASSPKGVPVAVYGAGSAGRQLVEVLRRSDERYPVLLIDDDSSLRERTIEDLLVINPKDKNFKNRLLARGVKEILLAIPSVTASRRRAILEFLGDLPFHVRSIPGLSELVNGSESALARLKEVSIEELLGRELVSPLSGLLEKCVNGKIVLVTGGGGSIGSELCRQALALKPERLIVLDHSEFALYRIEQELLEIGAKTRTRAQLSFALGSVTDPVAVASLLKSWRVDTIYHAAAYKHVPIVERNPLEGLRNNILGTWYTARAAARAGVGHFVLISSDKAVRPTNVMGATKRVSELVVQTMAAQSSKTVFAMVRFGNVLDSSGSVVPLFREQIERGGPVTLTHPDVTRYFMTIEEAVQLVVQAGAMAQGGEVFLLDMGSPVKIMDLAMKMIRLGGHSVGGVNGAQGDIKIELIGLRPGEKLYEELLITGDASGTEHPRIWQALENTVNAAQLEKDLEFLEKSIQSNPQGFDADSFLTRWVVGYKADAVTSLIEKRDQAHAAFKLKAKTA